MDSISAEALRIRLEVHIAQMPLGAGDRNTADAMLKVIHELSWGEDPPLHPAEIERRESIECFDAAPVYRGTMVVDDQPTQI